MVPETGIEPVRPLGREILSLLCLPVSPLGQRVRVPVLQKQTGVGDLEAEVGIEPAYTELQSAA